MNFKTIKDRLAEALTEKGYSFSDAQLEYVLDCENFDGIQFRFCSRNYIHLMFEGNKLKTKTNMVLEKRKLRLVSKRFKNILLNIIFFIIVSIGSVGLLMLGGLLDKI